jgi:hypothetical protein
MSFDRNYNKSALEVKDKYGDIVLQILLLSDRIRLEGKFYNETGEGVALIGRKDGVILNIKHNYSKFDYDLVPIFKYPSNLHFGELA